MSDDRTPADRDEEGRSARALAEIDEVFEDLDRLLKNEDVARVLFARGVNTSIAMVLGDGFRAYLRGEKERALEDLGTAIEEIAQRYAQRARGDA